MQDFLIRTATPDDLPRIYLVWYVTETVGEADPPPLGEPHPWLNHVLRTGTLLVAEHDSMIVGFAGIIAHGDLIFLTDLFVAPQMQSYGVGGALLDAILPRDGRTLATIGSSDPRALALYIRAGMTPEWPDFQIVVERERWRPPDLTSNHVEMIETARMEEDLLAFDAEISGRLRPEEHEYWLDECAGTAFWFQRAGERIGYGYVRLAPDTTLQPAGMAVVGPIGVRDAGDGAACVIAATGWALERAPDARLLVPGPHPALRPLLNAGGMIEYVETFLCSAPPSVDASRYLPSDGTLF
ncbi:MAG TPA: GNAT family N-acetyltransferase [Ktedonobacterales bacterium]|jgi:ribosomal protein S18 acetylase RimI-like enzyme